MSAANIPQLGFGSESQYDVNYYSDQEDVNFLDTKMIYLSEAVDNCIKYKCRAELWSAGFGEKVGFVDSRGKYRLIK